MARTAVYAEIQVMQDCAVRKGGDAAYGDFAFYLNVIAHPI
jgi:hypothetical protein